MEFRAEPLDDVGALLLGEVGREAVDGLDKVVRLNSTIGCIRSGEQLEQRPGVIADDLDLRSRIGVTITLGEQLEKIDPDLEEKKEKY